MKKITLSVELSFTDHMSELKCKRGLNLYPMVQVTVKPCCLMITKHLNVLLDTCKYTSPCKCRLIGQ